MVLSVQKTDFKSSMAYKTPITAVSKNNTPELPSPTETTTGIDLNNDPKAVNFKGFFSKKKPVVYQEPRIFGPYKLTQSQIDRNDKETGRLVYYVAKCMEKNAPEPKYGQYSQQRADTSMVKIMTPVLLSTLAYYSTTGTSFPEFYDSIARSLPKVCGQIDEGAHCDNAVRLYESAMRQITKWGKLSDPKTDDPVKAGITYLYFADNLPPFKLQADEKSTEETLLNMQEGRIPTLKRGSHGFARCHLSNVKDEINIYGTPYILEHFGYTKDTQEGKKITNSCGWQTNMNYERRPDPPVQYETVEIDPWEYNP